jgi:hypothetical protein
MNDQDRYASWLQARRQVGVSADFADRIMAQVNAAAPTAAPLTRLKSNRALEWFAAHALARAAAILLAAMLAVAQGILLVRVGLG